MGYSKILALDLGKFKSVGCVMDAATREHAFATLETSHEAIKAWVVTHAAAVASQTLVAFEACDAAGWAHDLLSPLGVAVTVVSAAPDDYGVKGHHGGRDDHGNQKGFGSFVDVDITATPRTVTS